jgi:Zn-dependent protease
MLRFQCLALHSGNLLYGMVFQVAGKDCFVLKRRKNRGIKIRLHFTLIICFLLITWTTASVFTQHQYQGFTTTYYWTMGAIIAAILFISVLLHELAHSMVVLRYGINIRQIILFIFGGVSDISEETKDYRKEAVDPCPSS